MAILRVAQLGHPVLRIPCEPVSPAEIATPVFQQFCEDMLETMDEYDGAGLAAPQVHISMRVVVLTLSEDVGPEFLINPVITILADTTRRTWEGCLSVEGMRGLVERADHVRVDALGRDGEPLTYELQGFPAVVVQHECDHLDGIVYIDRALPRSLSFTREYRRYGPPDEYVSDDDFDDEEEGWVDDGYQEELTDESEILSDDTDHGSDRE
jgi:peptide deformylase